MTAANLPAHVCVLADEAGVMGGAAKAALLLCEALALAGSRVELFVTARPEPAVVKRLTASGVRCHIAPVRLGSKLGLPARSTGVRAWLTMRFTRGAVLHAVGMQREVAQFLSLPGVFRTFVWETTEALPSSKFVHARMPQLLKKVEALLVPSRAVGENARANYAYRGRMELLPFWTEDRGQGVVPANREAPKRFLFVGRMDEDKGFRYLVPAFSRAREIARGIVLDICGSGDPGRIPELRPPPPGATARGSVTDAELDTRYAECFAFVLPSLHEGYPLTLLEACSYGKPVIATSVGSIPELFADRECAILVPPADSAALESAMLAMLAESAEQHERRARDARNLYIEACSIPKIISTLAIAYSGVRSA